MRTPVSSSSCATASTRELCNRWNERDAHERRRRYNATRNIRAHIQQTWKRWNAMPTNATVGIADPARPAVFISHTPSVRLCALWALVQTGTVYSGYTPGGLTPHGGRLQQPHTGRLQQRTPAVATAHTGGCSVGLPFILADARAEFVKPPVFPAPSMQECNRQCNSVPHKPRSAVCRTARLRLEPPPSWQWPYRCSTCRAQTTAAGATDQSSACTV